MSMDTVNAQLADWRTFERLFREQFCRLVQDQDRLNDSQRRLQRKNETAAKFVNEFRKLVDRFKRPPSQRQQVEMAFAQLQADYRRFMAARPIDSLEAIVRYGGEYELHLQWDSRHKDAPKSGALPAEKKAKIASLSNAKVKSTKAKQEKVSPPAAKRSRRQRGSRPSESWSEEEEVSFVDSRGMLQRAKMRVLQQPPPARREISRNFSDRPAMRGGNAWRQESTPKRFSSQPSAWQRGSAPLQWPQSSAPPTVEILQQPTLKPLGQQPSLQAWAGSQPGKEKGSPCFVCNELGHRANECPARVCFTCGALGHSASQCSAGKTPSACQLCDTPGVTLKSCPKCVKFMHLVENAKAGQ